MKEDQGSSQGQHTQELCQDKFHLSSAREHHSSDEINKHFIQKEMQLRQKNN